MWRNRSLIYPVVGFLIVVVVTTLVLGYTINYTILKDVLHDKVNRQANDITLEVRASLDQKIEQVTHFKDSWMENMSWLWLDTAKNGREDSNTLASFESNWNNLANFLPFWKLDYLLLLDSDGNVRHQLPATMKGVPKARPIPIHLRRSAKSQQWMMVSQVAAQWGVQVVAPLSEESTSSQLLLFGYHLKTLVNQVRSERPKSRFLLITGEESKPSLPNAHLPMVLDPDMVRKTIQNQTPLLAFDASQQWNLYYSPVTLLDRTLCLVLAIDLEPIRAILANSRQQLLLSLLFMLFMLALVAWGLNRLLLAPLRALYENATVIAEICSEEGDFNVTEEAPIHGNEIIMLEHVMQISSQKLYAHLSGLRESKQLLEGLALKDPLTELLNQRMFVELLSRALQHAHRNHYPLTVMVMELDSGQRILVKHSMEELLKQTAIRLIDCLRGEDLAFHIDEQTFAAFIPECGDSETLHTITRRILQSLAVPIKADSQTFQVTTSIGVTLFPAHGVDVESLITRADAALLQAKKDGGNRYQLFDVDSM